MEYVYDIVLNFGKYYYDFYEWKISDKLINVKKIKLYKVTNRDYLNLKYNDVIIENNIFSKMILVTNGIEVMGIKFDKNGKLLERSSLLISDVDLVLDNLGKLENTQIKYLKNVKKEINNLGRNYMEKNNYLDNFFDRIDFFKDEYLLKYVYYEITNDILDDVKIVYNRLLDIRKKDYNLLYETVYNINRYNKKGI